MTDIIKTHMPPLAEAAQASVSQCKSNRETIAVGACLIDLAERVLGSAMGSKGAAEVFYQVADRLAAKSEP